MWNIKTLVVVAVVVVTAAERRFPADFKFGAATASYQVEGGWNASDKGESIWDRFTHSRPEAILGGSNGDVACDSYHLWRDDIRLLQNLNVDFYRFSISWPRLLPTGYPNYISEDGSRYYSDLIDGLLEAGIEPVVTIFHWDLPQTFQDLGGWANPLISDWFADYTRVVFDLYADRVNTWLTINEPMAICDFGYNGAMAPGIVSEYRGAYLCSKHVMLAHAKAYRMYEADYKDRYQGRVSIANQFYWLEPETEDYRELTELALDHSGTSVPSFPYELPSGVLVWHVNKVVEKSLGASLALKIFGRYAHPILAETGGWPPALEKFMEQKSKEEGEPRSRLPPFTQEEIDLIRGSYDFMGINYYVTGVIRPAISDDVPGYYLVDSIEELGLTVFSNPEWTTMDSSMLTDLTVHPEGLRNALNYLKQRYGDVEVMITENGYSGARDLDDEARVEYFRDHLAQLLLAIEEDGIKLTGFTAWSLMDSFEWFEGYEAKLGLHAVDFTSPNRTRTPRRSAYYYEQVARTHDIDAEYHFEGDTK